MVGLRGRLRFDEPLGRYTAWGIGGPADRFYEPADVDDLIAFVDTLAPDEPLYWLGLGSNLLVRDGGIRGVVVYTANRLSGLSLLPGSRIRAEAGVPCAKLARLAWQSDLLGAEFLAGIPGTVGGALAMNAGAWGGETWPLVVSVEVLGTDGRRQELAAGQFQASYRHVSGPPHRGFMSALFELRVGDGRAAEARVKALLRQRALSQPTGQRSCGSVFRNPPGDHAARLIESCGLKGHRMNGAHVSTKHANFIINDRNASAADVEALIVHVRDEVRTRSGVELIPEVCIVGEVAP
ncbi:MAG: UDP-N-acetylmuramate dehydrogenase [Gammaproteobacteria bacterium]|nr:UDP-N-acetylmuramate dehydrogenase [Gammaproteobacteria bacterium]